MSPHSPDFYFGFYDGVLVGVLLLTIALTLLGCFIRVPKQLLKGGR